jgi:phage repressor protein C with HTH and peptisase S24 domain
MPTFGDRLQELIEHYAAGNISEFARRLQGNRASVHNWLKEETPTASALGTILLAFPEVDVRWLSGKAGDMFGSAARRSSPQGDTVALDSEAITIEEVDVEVAAGDGAEVALERVSGEVTMPDWYIRTEYGMDPERLRFVRARGSSMEPTIMPGQRMLVGLWQGETLRDGWVYVIYGPGGLQVKRLFIEPGNIRIWSDNPEAPRFKVPLRTFTREYRIVAVALEINRKL